MPVLNPTVLVCDHFMVTSQRLDRMDQTTTVRTAVAEVETTGMADPVPIVRTGEGHLGGAPPEHGRWS